MMQNNATPSRHSLKLGYSLPRNSPRRTNWSYFYRSWFSTFLNGLFVLNLALFIFLLTGHSLSLFVEVAVRPLTSKLDNDRLKIKDEMEARKLQLSLNYQNFAGQEAHRNSSARSSTYIYGQKPPPDCDLLHGTWIPSPEPRAQYNDATCPYISVHQNCRGNGRPDLGFENWLWKPNDCDLPKFNAHRFLDIMRGKKIAFVGDSVARNQMESLLCLLSQVEAPQVPASGGKSTLRYLFKNHEMELIRIWSAWLVHEESPSDPQNYVKGFKNLHLDRTSEIWLPQLQSVDVLVLSCDHWWVKPAAYFVGGRMVGFQAWPGGEQLLRSLMNSSEAEEGSAAAPMNRTAAFEIAINFTFQEVLKSRQGLTIFRTVSPNHYLGGTWNTGGTCSNFSEPLSETVRSNKGFVEGVLKIQMAAYDSALAGKTAGLRSTFLLHDVVPSFMWRADGHPGRFRNNRVIEMGLSGAKNVSEDCLHWCTPGPIDTWNEMLLEMIDRAMPST